MHDKSHRSTIAYLLAAGVLALVFSLYFSPNLILDLATQVWSCF